MMNVKTMLTEAMSMILTTKIKLRSTDIIIRNQYA